MREHGGKSVAFVSSSEAASVATIRATVATCETLFADEGTGWDALHATSDVDRVNHLLR
jgi:hypothetical protein